MKDILTKLNTPRIRALLAAGIAYLITWLITKFGLQLSEDQRPQISVYAGLAVAWLFRDLHAKVADTGIKAVQAEMPVRVKMPDGTTEWQKIDGVVGDVTITNAKLLAVESPRPVPMTAAPVEPVTP